MAWLGRCVPCVATLAPLRSLHQRPSASACVLITTHDAVMCEPCAFCAVCEGFAAAHAAYISFRVCWLCVAWLRCKDVVMSHAPRRCSGLPGQCQRLLYIAVIRTSGVSTGCRMCMRAAATATARAGRTRPRPPREPRTAMLRSSWARLLQVLPCFRCELGFATRRCEQCD